MQHPPTTSNNKQQHSSWDPSSHLDAPVYVPPSQHPSPYAYPGYDPYGYAAYYYYPEYPTYPYPQGHYIEGADYYPQDAMTEYGMYAPHHHLHLQQPPMDDLAHHPHAHLQQQPMDDTVVLSDPMAMLPPPQDPLIHHPPYPLPPYHPTMDPSPLVDAPSHIDTVSPTDSYLNTLLFGSITRQDRLLVLSHHPVTSSPPEKPWCNHPHSILPHSHTFNRQEKSITMPQRVGSRTLMFGSVCIQEKKEELLVENNVVEKLEEEQVVVEDNVEEVVVEVDQVVVDQEAVEEQLIIAPSSSNDSTSTATPAIKSSWAGLFQSSLHSSSSSSTTLSQSKQAPKTPPSKSMSKAKKKQEKNAQVYRHVVESFVESYQAKLIQPRGLINNGNMCFMNVILQPLVHCPPFYNFFTQLAQQVKFTFKSDQKVLSLVESMILFLQEFTEQDPDVSVDAPIENTSAFNPDYIFESLQSIRKLTAVKGKQEDAEEFLGYLLDGLHEELLSIQNTPPPPSLIDNEQQDWLEVGMKNKTMVTRQTHIKDSPMTRIFGGTFRSIIKCAGMKNSVNVEPFTTLQLDITSDDVKTIEDAISRLNTPEILEDYTTPQGSKAEATKHVFIERAPPVLILHMKRFVYDELGGTLKLHKYIHYDQVLKLNSDWLSPTTRTTHSKLEYRLFAVIYHHGQHAAGGHYTVDVQRQNSSWLSVDDDSIVPTTLDQVTQSFKHKQAYMLYYIQC